MMHSRIKKISKTQKNYFKKILIIEKIEDQSRQQDVNEQQQSNLNIYMFDINIQIINIKA